MATSLARKLEQREGLRAELRQDAKVLAHQIAGHTHTMEHDEEQLCYTETRIDAVQKIDRKASCQRGKATEIRQKQHPSSL